MPTPAHVFGDPVAVRSEAEAWGRAHVAGGGKLVGVVTGSAPVELIEAAGMSAIELSAGDVTATPLADEIMEDLFHPPIRGILERVMRGEFVHLSAIVLPRTSDAPHRLYYYLCELERTGAAVPKPLLFDVTQTPGAASEAYTAQALVHLWTQLKAIGGGSEGGLAEAIKASNQRRAALLKLVDRRRAAFVPGREALAAFIASRMLPREQVDARLGALLSGAGEKRQGKRIVIAGSAQDDAGLHELIEQAGGVVVGDAHGAGEFAIGEAIDETLPPMTALVKHYRATNAGVRSFSDASAGIVAFAKSVLADGVVFSYFPEEEALTWDYPEQVKYLNAAGVASVRLGDQARPFDQAARREEVQAFLKSLGAT